MERNYFKNLRTPQSPERGAAPAYDVIGDPEVNQKFSLG